MNAIQVLAFVGLALAYAAGIESRTPLLVISFDGLQAAKLDDWLKENPSSNLKRFIDEGAKAEYMVPSFPAVSWPNHMTLVTGKLLTEVKATTKWDTFHGAIRLTPRTLSRVAWHHRKCSVRSRLRRRGELHKWRLL